MIKKISAVAASTARRTWENSHRFLRPFQLSSEVLLSNAASLDAKAKKPALAPFRSLSFSLQETEVEQRADFGRVADWTCLAPAVQGGSG
jgi:hypothetical protein